MKNKFMASALAFAIATPAIVMPMTVSAEQAKEKPKAPQAQTESERVFEIANRIEKQSASFMKPFAQLKSVSGIKDKVLTGEPITITVNVSSLPMDEKYALMVISQSGSSYTTSPVYGKDVIKGKGTYSVTVPKEALNKKHSAFLVYSLVILNKENKPTGMFNSIGTIPYYNNFYDEYGTDKNSTHFVPTVNGVETNKKTTSTKPNEKEVLPSSSSGGNYGKGQNGNPNPEPEPKSEEKEKEKEEITSPSSTTVEQEQEKEKEDKDSKANTTYFNGKYLTSEELDKEKERIAKEEEARKKKEKAETEKEKKSSTLAQLGLLILFLILVTVGYFTVKFINKKKTDNKDLFK